MSSLSPRRSRPRSSCLSTFRVDGQMEAVFDTIARQWGKLDICVHSIAFAPKADLQGRVVDCSKEGFLLAMEVSCWSFIRMAKLAEPLMKDGGTLSTMTYYGSQMVVEHYNMMGPVKAALEASVRYLAAELGPKGIRVHAISPGPLKTRAASGITDFDELIAKAQEKAPSRQPRVDRGRRRRGGLPLHERSEADHRRDALYRRRLSHHRLNRDGSAKLHRQRSPEGWHRRHHSGHSPRGQGPPVGGIQEPRPGVGLPALLQSQERAERQRTRSADRCRFQPGRCSRGRDARGRRRNSDRWRTLRR